MRWVTGLSTPTLPLFQRQVKYNRKDLLADESISPDVFAKFGFWINNEKRVFEDAVLVELMLLTLQRAKGRLEFDHALLKKLPAFVTIAPEKTLSILRELIINGVYGDHQKRNWFFVDEEIVEIFRRLYGLKKSDTEDLINELLDKGGREFWSLADIVKS